MKILFVHRKGIFDFEGGEQDQIRNTRAALEKLGVQVDLTDTLPANLSDYDLIHYFGLDVCHIDEIRRAGSIPKILTPVFWDRAQGYLLDDMYEEWPRPGHELKDKLVYLFRRFSGLQNRRIALTARGYFYNTLRYYSKFQQVINEIDMFLPNSEAEMRMLSTFYIIDNARYKTVPNAIDIGSIDVISDYAQRNLPAQTPFVLCSGGIDRRKNQYSLVKALLDVDVPLVFAGGMRELRYFQATQRLAARRRGTFFLGHLNKPDLYSLYKAAKVHTLSSFHETPGIANLEAVAHECVNVSTQIGGLREYLSEFSLYCNPFSVDHIREQVLQALELPPNVEGAQFVRNNYTYEKAAMLTLDTYRSILK